MATNDSTYIGEIIDVEHHESKPSLPKRGDVYYDLTENRPKIYNGKKWCSIVEVEGGTPLDQTMITFQNIVNNSGMGMKLIWINAKMMDTSGGISNNPNFWAGVAISMYTQDRIDDNLMTDIIFALKGLGASADHFDNFIRDFHQKRQI